MIKFIDLFAGIGGIRKGFKHSDWKCVFTSENDPYAAKSYSANFPGEVIHGDITSQATKDAIPQFDVLMAGFPCQPFSLAGARLGFADPRGNLFVDIMDVVEAQTPRPRVLFLENVKNLGTHDEGRTLETIMDYLHLAGYPKQHIHTKVLNAKDFGVPQNRERIYIVAFRDAIDSNWFEFPVGTGLYKKVWDILEPADQVDPKHTLSSSLMDYYGPKIRKKAFGATVIDENTSYTHTLLATYYKNYQMILVGLGGWHLPNYHPRTRKLTPLECARLQGYDDFVFDKTVSDMQLYKQFGNSVAIPVIRALAEKIREALC